MSGLQVPVLYLDIDNTVREGYPGTSRFVNDPADVKVFPEAVELMRRWKQGGGRVVGVSNQGGIALGFVTAAKVREAMAETQRQCDFLFDVLKFCPHHPDAVEPSQARCLCRKPRIGMLVDAILGLEIMFGNFYPAHLALMVGDREDDERCAANAGIDFMWAHEWRAQV